ncbi:hypothetical protein MUCCIDRAFT_104849 [Mucor lusitanicus CBS 277.49]|uniref:RING-type domain-containing protein n=1 Tax=Mucor lusitanicus CBS 277.49 TaxID=747725 RepID=A0A162RQ37_MUCCL|nr:hypothetical protein MUCCIDRAFT_104849 [Mucor lusitanicus CBS 277.49]
MDLRNTVLHQKDYKSGIVPFENLTAPDASGLEGTLYDRGYSCQLNASFNVRPPSVSFLPSKIALVKKGGGCNFYDKVYYSELDGAKGVIIYDDVPFRDDDTSGSMKIIRGNLTISMYYVDLNIGLELLSLLEYTSSQPINTTFDNSTTFQPAINLVMHPAVGGFPSAWEFTLIIVVALLAISFLASVGMHWHLWRIRRRQRALFESGLLETAHIQQVQKRTIDPASLSLFPTRIIGDEPNLELSRVESTRSTKALENAELLSSSIVIPIATPTTAATTSSNNARDNEFDDACVICLDEFALGDQVRKLPCGHEYHCEYPWLTIKSASCPLCKHDCALDVPKTEADEDELEQAERRFSENTATAQLPPPPTSTPSPPPPSYHSFFSSLRSSHNGSPSSAFGPTISADRAEEFSRSWMARSLPRNMRRQIHEAAQQAAAANRESVIELPARMTNNTPEQLTSVNIPVVEPSSTPPRTTTPSPSTSRWNRMRSTISSFGRR